MTHSELLEAYFVAERYRISDSSGDIARDMRELYREVNAHAGEHDLDFYVDLPDYFRLDES